VRDIPDYKPSRMQQEHEILKLFRDPEFFLENLDTNEKTPIFHRFTLIGNDKNNPIYIKDPSVSPEHACLDI
jgi:pSer/pThr/pTyr-binding forkhead associated (FHA) protein